MNYIAGAVYDNECVSQYQGYMIEHSLNQYVEATRRNVAKMFFTKDS